jgi:hypothetical protein
MYISYKFSYASLIVTIQEDVRELEEEREEGELTPPQTPEIPLTAAPPRGTALSIFSVLSVNFIVIITTFYTSPEKAELLI